MPTTLFRLLAPVMVTGALLAGAVQPAGAAPSQVPSTAATTAPVAASSAARACTPDPLLPKRQLRGEWLVSVLNIDWPSAPGLSERAQKAELVGWLDEARADGLNAVVLHVRPTADAFWPSPYEPWSAYLSGRQGVGPGYDPLQFAVEQAHRRGLELHAWFNPYRVSMGSDVTALTPDHPARTHPDWRVSYGGKLYYNPGVPAARRFVEKAIMHAVRTYDIDAVHFDDYFYPYPTGARFPDRAAFREYGDAFPDTEEGLADWRRRNINLLISELDRRIEKVKPWVTFGVSPFAIWRNASTDPEGSQTQGGIETYDDLYADTRLWVRRGWVDYVAPQVYWNIGYAVADYAKVTRWWSNQVEGTGVRLYVGQAAYKIGDPDEESAWNRPGEMRSHLTFNRDLVRAGGQVDGDIFYSGSGVRANVIDGMDLAFDAHYQRPALPPVSTFVPGGRPGAPKRLQATRADREVTLTWRSRAAAFAVYRYDSPDDVVRCSRADAAHLVGRVRRVPGERPVWTAQVGPRQEATFVVTALTRAHREGRPAQLTVTR